VFTVLDEQHAVFGVFVPLLLVELPYTLCYCCCDVVPVFRLDCGVVDAVDVACVVLPSCTERTSHRSVEQVGEQCGEFTFGAVSFTFVLVRHLASLASRRATA